MDIELTLNETDRSLQAQALDGFVPDRVFDIHGHLLDTRFCPEEQLPDYLKKTDNFAAYRQGMEVLLPGRTLEGALMFPFPARRCDMVGLNKWMFSEIDSQGGLTAKSLALAAPYDDPKIYEQWMAEGSCIGLKPYHYYSGREDTLQAELEEFAPEWMWALCDRYDGILMIHLVRDGAVSDPGNREAILRLAAKYPRCRLVLPHIARAFNFRTARGLKDLVRLPNIHVDTSAITEAEGMRIALELLGPKRVLFGTDYPISHLRGHCATAGAAFHWFYSEEINEPNLTLTGLESLLCLREACEQVGLQKPDIESIFLGNAQALVQR